VTHFSPCALHHRLGGCTIQLNFHLALYPASLTGMKIRSATLGFVLRASGMLLIVGGLACGSSSLEQPGDASGPGGATSHGGTNGTGGAAGYGGMVGSGGATGLGGATGSGGAAGSAAGSGTGGVPSSGGRASTGGATTGGATGSDGGPDAPASADVSPETSRADVFAADRADTAIIGTGDASGPGTDTGVTDALSAGAQEYVNTYLLPYCTRLSECCAQAGLPYSGLGACEAYELGFVKYLNDGTEAIVPSVIQTLLNQMKNSCDHPSYALIGATTDGTRTSGQSCVAVDQCAGTPALCLTTGTAGSGACMTPPRGKAGDGCAVTCDDTTVCKWGTSAGKSPYSVCYDQDKLRCDSATNTCVAVTAIGKPCTDYSECGAHAECSSGACLAFAQVGQECSGMQRCDRNLQCIANSGGTKSTCQTLSMAWSGSCSP